MDINKKPRNKKGFTLIEVIIAIVIFSIISIGSSAVFAGAFKSYKNAKNVNENVKNTQFAINLMSKVFRTSSVKYKTTTAVIVYDYSQPACIRYRFNANNLYKSTASVTEANCNSSAAFSTEISMTSGAVTGSFDVIDSDGDDSTGASKRVGKVTVSIYITSGSGTGTGGTASVARIQSTSSLRDYTKSNVGIDPNNDPL